MRPWSWISLFLAAYLSIHAQESEAQFFFKQERPEWVEPTELPALEDKAESESGSIRFALSDGQHHLEEDIWYRHVAIKILSETGVEDYSQLDFDFQPEYQQILLHELTVIRDGQRIDKLEETEFRIIEREEDMDSLIYDGEKTVVLILKDIRPGDTLSYAYSRKGLNPVFKGHHHNFNKLSYGIDVGLIKRRVIWDPEQRNLNWQVLGEAKEPSESQSNGLSELKWEQSNLKKSESEDHLPRWIFQSSWLEYSDYADWADLRAWFKSLFPESDPLPAEIITVCEELQANSSSKEELAVKTLRWVQRNVRYLGSFMGEHTHEPHPLADIVERRFGDCKDQGTLLVAMLTHLGFDAVPALVNTSRQKAVAEYLPGHSAFNHLIVHLRLDEEDYWLDPTYTYQGGPLETLHIGEYGFALTMQEDERGLTPLKPRGFEVDQTTVEEFFTILDKGTKATLKVVTTTTGGDANRQRSDLASDSLDEFEEGYLEFYQSLYPGMEKGAPITYQDDRESNIVTITEHYEIENLLVLDEGENPNNRRTVTLMAHLIDDKVGLPDEEDRESPYAVAYPNNLTHIIHLTHPDDWVFEPSTETLNHPSFNFTSQKKVEENALTLVYKYQSHASAVSAESFPSYRKNIKEMLDDLYYEIYQADPAVSEDTEASQLGLILWGSGATIGAIIGLGTIALLFFFWNPAPRLPSTTEYRGLGGWMVLPTIGTTIAPLMAFYLLYTYFTPLAEMDETLQSETVFLGWRLYYFSGALTETLYFCFSLLLVILLFSKRTSFPYFHIFVGIFTIVSELAIIGLESQLIDLESEGERAGELPKMIFTTILWSSYMLRSQRVKATFTKRFGKSSPPPIPEGL